MDYSALLYSPVYDLMGVRAVLTPRRDNPPEVVVTVLDKTAGVDVSEAMNVMSVRPAATVRTQDLTDAGVAVSELDGGLIAFNGRTWRIDLHHMRPSPGGDQSGEVMMFLVDESSYG